MISLLIWSVFASANPDVGVQTNFLRGVQQYQAGQYTEAEQSFRADYENGVETAPLLHNWGLASYQIGRRGMGVALWRRALFVSPEYLPSLEALDYAAGEMPSEVFSANRQGWEWYRSRILNRFDLEKAGFVTYVLFLVGGFLWIRFLSQRRKALLEEKPLPAFPSVAVALTVIFLVSLFVTGAKAYSLRETRATVIAASVPLRTGPSADDNTLVDLIEGIEVIVKNTTKDWIQVRYPGGPAGWVPKETIFQTTGERKLW